LISHFLEQIDTYLRKHEIDLTISNSKVEPTENGLKYKHHEIYFDIEELLTETGQEPRITGRAKKIFILTKSIHPKEPASIEGTVTTKKHALYCCKEWILKYCKDIELNPSEIVEYKNGYSLMDRSYLFLEKTCRIKKNKQATNHPKEL
jgi:hypothetical protein